MQTIGRYRGISKRVVGDLLAGLERPALKNRQRLRQSADARAALVSAYRALYQTEGADALLACLKTRHGL